MTAPDDRRERRHRPSRRPQSQTKAGVTWTRAADTWSSSGASASVPRSQTPPSSTTAVVPGCLIVPLSRSPSRPPGNATTSPSSGTCPARARGGGAGMSCGATKGAVCSPSRASMVLLPDRSMQQSMPPSPLGWQRRMSVPRVVGRGGSITGRRSASATAVRLHARLARVARGPRSRRSLGVRRARPRGPCAGR